MLAVLKDKENKLKDKRTTGYLKFSMRAGSCNYSKCFPMDAAKIGNKPEIVIKSIGGLNYENIQTKNFLERRKANYGENPKKSQNDYNVISEKIQEGNGGNANIVKLFHYQKTKYYEPDEGFKYVIVHTNMVTPIDQNNMTLLHVKQTLLNGTLAGFSFFESFDKLRMT